MSETVSTDLNTDVSRSDTPSYSWIPAYAEMAKQIRKRDNAEGRAELLQICKNELGMDVEYVDPLALFLRFNRSGNTEKSRPAQIRKLMKALGIEMESDADLRGIPTAYQQFGIISHNPSDAEKSWQLFDLIVDEGEEILDSAAFPALFDEVASFNSKTNFNDLTKLLYMIAPQSFFPLHGDNNNLVKSRFGLSASKIANHSAEGYIRLINQIKEMTDEPFWELSHQADPHYATTESEGDTTDMSETSASLNTILYGAPGTGKTYEARRMAVRLCDPEFYAAYSDEGDQIIRRFNELSECGRITFVTFHQSFSYEEFVEGIRPSANTGGAIAYNVRNGALKTICDKRNALGHSDDNYVLIIDEVNRGDVSRIFGELITLLEPNKRLGAEEALEVKLPYSGELFGIPSNVYVICTMNTADKSLTQIDTALRRRFQFAEVGPNPTLLREDISGIDLQQLLRAMNARIEVLHDRDHVIGHSYLMGVESLEELKERFEHKIIPLLQEYFYNNYEKIRLVLNGKPDKKGFVVQDSSIAPYLTQLEMVEPPLTISNPSTWTVEDFIDIYSDDAKA